MRASLRPLPWWWKLFTSRSIAARVLHVVGAVVTVVIAIVGGPTSIDDGDIIVGGDDNIRRR